MTSDNGTNKDAYGNTRYIDAAGEAWYSKSSRDKFGARSRKPGDRRYKIYRAPYCHDCADNHW